MITLPSQFRDTAFRGSSLRLDLHKSSETLHLVDMELYIFYKINFPHLVDDSQNSKGHIQDFFHQVRLGTLI